MIVLDTHIFVYWVHANPALTDEQKQWIKDNEASGLLISAISLWEIAKLVEYKRLVLPCPINEWFDQALAYPGIQVLNLTPQIVIESTQLPDKFHSDPADQLIVATARICGCPLLTNDSKILNYPHVKLLSA
jgi:PIN domain nuclease of toxin-antitoxin system